MKIKKIFLALITMFSAFFMLGGVTQASASTLNQVKHSDVWFIRKGAGINSASSRFAEYSIDGEVTYCIEPGVQITSDTYYGEIGYVNSPYSPEINDRIGLIAYYGYEYPGHNTLRYRMATQFLIWKLTSPQTFEYWTEASGAGTYIDISYEENEILKLVNSHYDKPSFQYETKSGTIGQNIDFVDNTGALSKFEVVNSEGINASINGNILSITSNKAGNITVRLRMKKYTDAETTIFVGSDGQSQKMGRFGLDDPISFEVYLNVSGASLEITKNDVDTNINIPQGDATLKGAKYELLDLSGNHITYLETDIYGKAKTDNILALNTTYILKEREESEGYLLNETVYQVKVGDSLEVKYNVTEKVKEKKVDVFKLYANGNTGIITPEANVTFDIFLKSTGEYYKSITTSELGQANIMLPYGVWIFKQVNSTLNFEKVDDFEVSITDNIGKITKYLSNAEITARLKVIKIDEDTGKIIKRPNIKFKIYDITRDKYVCQTITYPTQETLCEFETQQDGTFVTPYPLLSGKYRLEEIDQKIGEYLWNSTSQEFEIGENSEFVNDEEYGIIFETKFANKPVKGKVLITKLGEQKVEEDGKIIYKEILLNDVEYELYADEDIISADGTLIYKRGQLVGTYATVNGSIEIDNMYLGKYYLIEKKTVNNHILDTEKHFFELSYKDQYTEKINIEFTFKNYLPKGRLEFLKTDELGNPLAGVTINLYKEDGTFIGTYTTNENGMIIVEDLELNNYIIKELSTVEGYELSEEDISFSITEAGETVNVTMVNNKLPQTDLNDYTVVIATTFIILGIVMFLTNFLLRKKGGIRYGKEKKIK